jgi:hypothetical protein
MPDTLDETGFDPERHIIGEDAIAELREQAIRVASVITGDTHVAQQRAIVLLMIAAAAIAFAPSRLRVPGLVALMLHALDVGRRRSA